MLSDKTLTWVDCGYEFTFTAGEQEFYASRGYTNEPRWYPQCRSARKSQQLVANRLYRLLGPPGSFCWRASLCLATGKCLSVSETDP
jgi:hypothetical protein